MTLKDYKEKRDFKKTPEPAGKQSKESPNLNFVIQKHAARRLHYDFRLECKGVLISWAVPKGPSSDPKDKRLAIHVEDHPLDYQYFEGVIPKGNYGAGTVEIWDKGTYSTYDISTKKEMENKILEDLKKGHLAIILHGEKLQGEYILQKLKKDEDDPSWLLIKKDDAFNELNEKKKPLEIKKKLPKLPSTISPMLATLVDKPFDDENWLFEIKWDGYRALAFIEKGKVDLKSRYNISWNEKFSSLTADLKRIPGNLILDGEIVIFDSEGKPQFHLIQNYQSQKGQGTLLYYVFDILYLNGQDLRKLPLIERKEILQKLLNDIAIPSIRFSNHILETGIPFFKEASKEHLEGIIGKKISSAYQSGRSRDWVKIKTSLRQEVVIGGFTEPKGTRKRFGALLIGFYNDKKELIFAGHVGGGFNYSLLESIYKKLEPLIQKKCPFKNISKTPKDVTWIKPKLVCEVQFTEWTKDLSLRHPVFKGLREDKEPKQVTKEETEKSPQVTKKKFDNKLALSNLDKIYWPKENYTKGDLISYYEAVSSYILPYFKDKPVMLHRFPDGITGNSFYQKNSPVHPSWIKTAKIQHAGKLDEYLIINNLDSLLYAVNLGSIDLHPFISRYKNLDNPDFCVIDLDPEQISFDKVVEVALTFHRILEEIEIKHFCKTSGKDGLHICIPFHAKYSFEQSRQFAEVISYMVHEQLPNITSLHRNPKKREKKIYLDCLQNRMGQTLVPPYTARPTPEASVSTPLYWEEVNEKLDPKIFTIKTIQSRLMEYGDLFKSVLGRGINLQKTLKKLKSQ